MKKWVSLYEVVLTKEAPYSKFSFIEGKCASEGASRGALESIRISIGKSGLGRRFLTKISSTKINGIKY